MAAKASVADKKLRKALAPALLLPVALAPVGAHALGLGALHVDSALGQPLAARIDLIGATPAQAELATVRLAPAEARERMGLGDPVLGGVLLRFDVKVDPGGRSYVQVTSSGPVREPFLDFVLEAVSPSGQVVRHYTVLLDPVGTAVAPPPTVSPALQTAAARQPVSVRVSVRDPFANVAPPRAGAEFGPVPPGATLWTIARRVRPTGASLDDVMASIVRSNPDAFINGDPGLLKAGSKLTIPDVDVLRRGAGSAAQPAAVAPVEAAATAQAEAPQDEAPAEPATPAAASAEAPQGEVRVIRSEDATDQAPADAPAAADAADAAAAGVGANRTQLLEESVDALQQQNDALQQRLLALEEQIRTMADLMKAGGLEPPVAEDVAAPAPTSAANPPVAEAEAPPATESTVVPASNEPGRLWPWVLGALAAVGVGGLVVRRRRRREGGPIEEQVPADALAVPSGESEPVAPARPTAPAPAPSTHVDPSTHVEWIGQAPAAAEPVSDGFGDPVDTQIDLLAAYVGMADGASARQVHAEIMRTGNAQQKAQAEALMAKLSG
ncbi:MAG: hypothetical protein Kow0073_00610 [Immundisolibacter sp.]